MAPNISADFQTFLVINNAATIAETWFFWTFFADARASISKIYACRYRSREFLFPHYLCCIQAVLGCIVTGLLLADAVLPFRYCGLSMTLALLLVYIGAGCINGILFIKAMAGTENRKRLVVLFVVLELGRLGAVIYNILTTYLGRTDQGRCFVYYLTSEALAITALTSIVEIVVLTVYFLQLVVRYVRLVPNSGYLRAAVRDGAVYGIAILICGTAAAVVNYSRCLGDLSDMIYVVEWTLASRLITMQLQTTGLFGQSTYDAQEAKHKESVISREDWI